MTQDSVLWWFGLVGSVLTIILGYTGLFSPGIEQWMKVIGAVVTGVFLYLKNSPLPRTQLTDAQRALLQAKVKP